MNEEFSEGDVTGVEPALAAWLEAAVDAALGLPATEIYTFTEGWEAARVKGKWFVLFTRLGGEPIVNVKAAPEDVVALTAAYSAITPGYHMNKKHWMTVRPGGDVSEEHLAELIMESYLQVVAALPKAQRPVDPETFGRL